MHLQTGPLVLALLVLVIVHMLKSLVLQPGVGQRKTVLDRIHTSIFAKSELVIQLMVLAIVIHGRMIQAVVRETGNEINKFLYKSS